MAENFNLDLPIKLIIIGPTYYVLWPILAHALVCMQAFN